MISDMIAVLPCLLCLSMCATWHFMINCFGFQIFKQKHTKMQLIHNKGFTLLSCLNPLSRGIYISVMQSRKLYSTLLRNWNGTRIITVIIFLCLFCGRCNKENHYADWIRLHTKVQNMAEVNFLVPVFKNIATIKIYCLISVPSVWQCQPACNIHNFLLNFIPVDTYWVWISNVM